MEAKSTDRKTLQLTEDGQQLGELVYKNLLSGKAEIKLANADLYEVRPVGIFSTSIAVKNGGAEIANLQMNWRGQIVFAFQNGREFVLKPKGVFYNKFIIENKSEEKVIQLDPKFNWSKFDYNYDIAYDQKPQDILLILLAVYASNYFIASMSGMV